MKKRYKKSKKYRSTPPGFWRKKTEDGRIVFVATTDEIINLHEEVKVLLGDVRFLSMSDCVRPHLKNRFFLKLDIEDAFGSVDLALLTLTTSMDFDFEIGLDGKYFFHKEGGLIQGAPASPKLFQVFCERNLDNKMLAYCEYNNLVYTRYVDDIFISSPKSFKSRKRKSIRNVLEKVGFSVNEYKYNLIDNHYTPLGFLGMSIEDGVVFLTDDFEDKILSTPPDTASYEGLIGWKDYILALNR